MFERVAVVGFYCSCLPGRYEGALNEGFLYSVCVCGSVVWLLLAVASVVLCGTDPPVREPGVSVAGALAAPSLAMISFLTLLRAFLGDIMRA